MNSKLRILIVDDDRRMTRTLSDILTMSGYEVSEACAGPEALEMIARQTFDCVLTDIKMPEMDGVEFHRQLSKIRPGLPVVLMTAYAAEATIGQGLEEGVVGVFEKPLNMTHLLGFFASLAKHHTVAIVDDDPAFCKTLAGILQQRGFSVTQITDPHLDIDSIVSASQIVLLDLKLNSINGLDMLRDIRARYPGLPVLLITGFRQEMKEVIQDALEINATACLYKPLEIPALLQMLSSVQLKRLRGVLAKK